MINKFFSKIYFHQGFQRYLINTSWMSAEQILRMITNLFVGIWVARYLGPNQFGILSYSLAFVTVFGGIAKLGLDGIVVRDLVEHPHNRNCYLGTAFWLKIAASITMLIVIALALLLLGNPTEVKIYILIIASGVIFQSFEVVDFYFQSQVASKFVSICKMIQLFTSSLIKIFLILTNADLFYFVIVTLIDQITLGIALYITYRIRATPSFTNYFNIKQAKIFLENGLPLMLGGIVISVYTRIDQIMINSYIGEVGVGVYSAAIRVSEIWYFIATIIATSLFPAIINSRKVNKDAYVLRIQYLYFFMFWSSVLIAIPMTFASNVVIQMLYGQAYAGAGQVLMIHIWTGIFVFLGIASSKWYIAEGLQKYLTLNIIFGAIINIFLNTFLIPKYGISGAAFATVVAQAVASYLMNIFYSETRVNFLRLTGSFCSPIWINFKLKKFMIKNN